MASLQAIITNDIIVFSKHLAQQKLAILDLEITHIIIFQMTRINNCKSMAQCCQSIPKIAIEQINHSPAQSKMIQFMEKTLENCKSLNASTRTSVNFKNAHSHVRKSIIPLAIQRKRVVPVVKRRQNQQQNHDQMSMQKSSQVLLSEKARVECESSKPYIQFFTMLSFMHNKALHKTFKSQILIDELIAYFRVKKQKEWRKQIKNILKISHLIRKYVTGNETGQFLYDTIKQCDGGLSKIFFSICYQFYLYKNNRQSISLLETLHRHIQQYSRQLHMLNLAMLSCLDLGKIYCEYFQLEKAAAEYTKVIKLAVLLGDKYYEELAIDKLGICEYYGGDIASANFYHKSLSKLSSYDRLKIHQCNEKDKQTQNIKGSTKEITFRNKENIEFNFDGSNKDDLYVQKNYDIFRKDISQLIKVGSLRKKVPIIKKAIHKVETIGSKKYSGLHYYVPQASKFRSKGYENRREEVLVSHRSHNRNELSISSIKMNRACKVIDQILNFFMAQQKLQRTIQEGRQPYISICSD